MRPVDSCQIYSSLSHPFFLDSVDFLTPFPSTGQFIFSISLIPWCLSHPQVNSFSQFRWLPDTFPIHGSIHPLNFIDPLMPFPSTGQFIFPNSSGSSTTYFSQSPHTHRMKKYQNALPHTETRDSGISHIPAYFHTLGGLKEPRGVQRGTASSPLRSSLYVNVNWRVPGQSPRKDYRIVQT